MKNFITIKAAKIATYSPSNSHGDEVVDEHIDLQLRFEGDRYSALMIVVSQSEFWGGACSGLAGQRNSRLKLR